MSVPTTEGKYQVEAFTHRVSRSVVFMFTQSPNDKLSVGTGFLVQFRGRRYFVSALHNFFYDDGGREQVIRCWDAARFKFRDAPPIGFVESLNFAVQRLKPDLGVPLPHLFPNGLFIDAKHDLIAVRVNSLLEEFASAVFLKLEEESFTDELNAEIHLLTIGMPFDAQVEIPGVGRALVPTLDHVKFNPNVDKSRVPSRLCTQDYFLVPYSLGQDEIEPHGFSGAPIFSQSHSSPSIVWTPAPRVVGVVMEWLRKLDLIAALRIGIVISLLESDHDSV